MRTITIEATCFTRRYGNEGKKCVRFAHCIMEQRNKGNVQDILIHCHFVQKNMPKYTGYIPNTVECLWKSKLQMTLPFGTLSGSKLVHFAGRTAMLIGMLEEPFSQGQWSDCYFSTRYKPDSQRPPLTLRSHGDVAAMSNVYLSNPMWTFLLRVFK